MTPAEPRHSRSAIAAGYHARTKHRRDRYAAGPETLDWTMQPNPFREFAGCDRTVLPLLAGQLATPYADVFTGSIAPRPVTPETLSVLLELSFGISAWKEYGPDRWALRCNPSSGNLHPTEAYVIAQSVPGLVDGLHHYVSRDHVLEHRCAPASPPGPVGDAAIWIGLTSIHWREAWKYGERALRYCQLDIGHALGMLRITAAVLGWTVRLVEQGSGAELAALLGVDRQGDFLSAEAEEAELLVEIGPPGRPPSTPAPWGRAGGRWFGQANILDPHPMYHWPVIDEAAQATRDTAAGEGGPIQALPPRVATTAAGAATIIQGRRSAQRFDPRHHMSAEVFFHLLDGLLTRAGAPWDLWTFQPRVHPALLVHRVDGVEPGLYLLPRRTGIEDTLRAALRPDFLWQRVAAAPAHLPLFLLTRADCRATAKIMSCHQAIAADGCFSLGMVAEFAAVIEADSWRYRQLHWEAGLIGQLLYLEAEAAGLRGTGIGCFFDDDVHDLLGLSGTRFQSLYHFTVGRPLTDERISTLPAYPGRNRNSATAAE